MIGTTWFSGGRQPLIIKALKGLNLAHNGLDRLLVDVGVSGISAPDQKDDALDEEENDGAPLLPWELIAVTQDIVSSARALADLEELQLHKIQYDSRKLAVLAETIEATLSELTSRMESPQLSS